MFDLLKKTIGRFVEKIAKKKEGVEKKGEARKERKGEGGKERIEGEGKKEKGKKKGEEGGKKEGTKKKGKEKWEKKAKVSVIKKLASVITGKIKIEEKDIAESLDEFELSLIESDVALEVAEEIKEEVKKRIVGKEVGDVGEYLDNVFREVLLEVMNGKRIDIVEEVRKSKERPFKIIFFGPNGAGKTTTMAKIAKLLLDNGFSVVFAAADTFRAAAIEQLEEHGKKLGVRVIKGQYGGDATAVAYDAVEHAKAKGIDVVLIDTAGRQHVSANLMKELEKMVRVIKPHLKIYVGESIAGNSLLEQVREFNERIGMDGVILTKLDLDAKGGTVISVRKATGVPVIYLSYGQDYDSIKPFRPEEIVERILGK